MNVLKLMIVISFFQVAQANPLIFMNFTRTPEKFNMKFYTEIAVGSKIMFKKKLNVNGTLLNLKSIELTHNGLVMTFADEPEFQIFINSYITEDSRYLVNRTRDGVRLRIVSTDTEVIDREFENLVDAYSLFLSEERFLRARAKLK